MSEIRRIIRAFTPAEFELFVALGGVAKEPRNWAPRVWHPVERWPGRSKAPGAERTELGARPSPGGETQ